MNQVIPVFFAIDDGYAPYLAVALRSAVENSDPERRYKAIILHQNISPIHKEKLAALAAPHFEVEFVAMEQGLETITDKMSNRLRCDYFTVTIYFRLFIPTMFPQFDKAIYIDSDVVVPGDLAELFDTELGENLIAACPDFSIQDCKPLVDYTVEAVGMERGSYVNSGVLLMNLSAMRREGFSQHFLELLNTYGFDCIAPDQDYINAICRGRIRYLDECWDAMPGGSRPPLEAPKLIHYNLFSKPWCYDGIQYGDIFWHYAEKSGYLQEIRAFKAGYTEAQKCSDRDCMDLLVRRGQEISAAKVTFRNMEKKGVRIRL